MPPRPFSIFLKNKEVFVQCLLFDSTFVELDYPDACFTSPTVVCSDCCVCVKKGYAVCELGRYCL